uniref:C2 domain-containing protein n=1 Tax=Strigamia maritima TaxID=126957 RepID=T1J093_STRMM
MKKVEFGYVDEIRDDRRTRRRESSEMMSTSGTMNLRENARNRIQRAKEKTQEKMRLKFLSEKSVTATRFDQVLEEESSNVDAAVQKVLGRRRLGTSGESEVDHVSSLDFFTREWTSESEKKGEVECLLYPSVTDQHLKADGVVRRFINGVKETNFWRRFVGLPQPPPPPPPILQLDESKLEPEPGPSCIEESESPTRAIEKVKISSHDLISSPVHWSSCSQVPAFVIPSHVRIKLEKQLYYFPSTKPPIVTGESGNVYSWCRNLEGEGFYVGQKARILSWNKNKIKNRLITEQSFKFFGADAELDQAVNPFLAFTFNRQKLSTDDEWADQLAPSIGMHLCSGINESGNRYQLDIHVKSIRFVHHHLFSVEHVLASKLMQLCEKLQQQENRDVISLINSRLQIVAAAIENISVEGEMMESDKRRRLQTYIQEIRQLRKQKDDEELLNRSLLKNILNLWKKIKDLRIKQGFINTDIAIQINRIDANFEEDQHNWKQEIQLEFEEEKLLHKVEKVLKERAKEKRKKKRKHQITDDDKFDRIKVLKNVRQKAMNQRRRPGEPKLQPVLTHGSVISASGCCSTGEQKRRAQVEKIKLLLRVLFNGKEVCRTFSKKFNDDFTINIEDTYNLHIFQKPEKIALQVYETWNFFKTNVIAEIYLPIPNSNTTSETAKFEEQNFSCESERTYAHEGVGSGANVNLNSQFECLFTHGIITCSTWWGMDVSGKVLCPLGSDDNKKIRDAIGAAGVVDRNQLGTWINESHLDPNDPANSAFLHLLRDSSEVEITEGAKHFRLNHLQKEFDFVLDDVIDKNPRLRLLQLRDQQIPEFQGLTMIPISTREIPSNIFDAYDRRQAEENVDFETDDVDTHRQRVQKLLEKIFNRIRTQHKTILFKTVLENIVAEEQVPDIRTLSLAMLHIVEPFRPLRPLRKEGKQIPTQLVSPPAINLLVTVVRGFNIPVRRDALRAPSTRRMMSAVSSFRSPKESLVALDPPVKPFVEISFQRHSVKTGIAEGSNPTWNQRLTLPIQIPTNFEIIHNVKDVLYLNIFDEVRTDVLEDERDRDVRVHERIERHWLGVLRIPFTTLYFNSRIEGTFKVETPPVYLGYLWNPDVSMEEGLRAPNATYLSLFITLDPGLPLTDKFEMKLEGEDPLLTAYADKWLSDLSKLNMRRVLKTFVINYEGCTVFIPRFIHPLNPPCEILDLKLPVYKTMELLARFVSLIPRHSISTIFSSMCDIWTTCDKMLTLMCGSDQEHAVLLCNYFLYLNQPAWLAFVAAIPEGPTAYVLTEKQGVYYLWRSTTGECFNCRDHFSPVTRIDCIVNQHNIWASTNTCMKPSQLTFKLHRTNLWKPFFTKAFLNPGLRTVQPEQLVYKQTNVSNLEKLESNIERTLRDKVMDWRSRHRTPWNRHCNRILKNVLPKLEQIRSQQMEQTDFIQEELADILTAYKVNGFPIDLPYVDMDLICESVYATGVHSFEHPDAEFSLGVYIHPYPNNIVAVWK